MGNASSELNPLFSADELNWKSGTLSDSVPAPIGNVTTYEGLKANTVFKDYLLKHVDSDYLASSIMTMGDGEIAFLKGIDKFKELEPEWIESFQGLVDNFQLCTAAGIELKDNDLLTMCEKEFSMGFKSSQAVFLASFQRRLACLRIMQICIELERKDSLATFPTKKTSEAEGGMSNQAQMMVLHGLKNAGISLITLFPMCYNALLEATQRELLAQPVKLFCDHLCNMANLELLKACTSSITEATDPRLLDLHSNAEISASSGTPGMVGDGNQETYWSGTHLSIILNAPCNLASVTLAWVPKFRNYLRNEQGYSSNAQQDVSAPRRIALFARTVDAAGVEQPQEKVFCVMPSVEFVKSGTWVQTYQVDLARVKALKFTLSIKGCDENTSGVSKLYNIDVTCADDAASARIRTLPLLKQVQRALMPLSNFSDVAKVAYDAQLSIVRSSGSLSVLLMLINAIYSTNAEQAVRQQSAPAVLKLLQAIHSANSTVRSSYNKLYVSEGSALDNVAFVNTSCQIASNSLGHSAVSCQRRLGAAVLSFELGTGTYAWTFTIDEESYGDESIFLGVVGESCRAATPENILKSTEAYFVRIYNGEIFQGRRCCALPVVAMHQGDKCRFTYHSERRAVSLRVNGVNQGVVFDNLNGTGLRPCVLFQHSVRRKTVSVSDVSLIYHNHSNNSNNNGKGPFGSEKTKLPIREVPTLSTVESAPSILTLLLSEVEELAVGKREELLCNSNASLVHAYCAEGSVELIVLLIALIQKLHASPSTNQSMLRSLLVILDLQFQCIKLSKIDLRDLGYHTEHPAKALNSDESSDAAAMNFESLAASYANTGRFTDPVVTRSALAAASVVLQNIMSGADAELAGAAVVAFSHGLSFFLPSTERKLALVADILRNMDVTDVEQIGCEPRLKLLQLLVQRFRDTSEILGFIEFVARDQQHAEKLATLMSILLELLISLQSEDAGLIHPNKSTSMNASEDVQDVTEFSTAQKSAFMNDLAALVSTYQQQLVYEILSAGPHPISVSYIGEALKKRQQQLCQDLLVPYMRALLGTSRKFLLLTLGADIAQESRRDAILRDSVVGALVHPLLYSLCLPGFELSFYEEICPDLVKLLALLTQYSTASTACATANNLILSTIPRATGSVGANKSGLGWRPVKTGFEDGEGTFTSTEGNTIFTSTTPNNTSAVVTTKFTSKQKAAWEFLLLADSAGDECSTFGAARTLTPSSRCYSSSPDLWMRRAYNGYLYQFGSSTGNTMDKIKPGDLVRVEYDGPAGTISYSLNGSDLQVAFSNITDDVYPACGSYRNGVAIKLVKVEVFDTLEDDVEDEVASAAAFARPTSDIKWLLNDDTLANTRDATLLSPAVPKGSKQKTPTVRWMTARADRGALYGVHEYTFELTQASKTAYCVGIVSGDNPYALDRLAGPCLKISSKTPKTCEISGSTLSLSATAGAASPDVSAQSNGSVPGAEIAGASQTDVTGAVASGVIAAAAGTAAAITASTGPTIPVGASAVVARVAMLARAAGIASSLAGATPVPPAPPVTFMPGASESDRSGSAVTVPVLTAPSSPNITRASSPVVDSDVKSSATTDATIRIKEQTPEIPLSRTYRYPPTMLALAWHSDGSLWHNGVRVADDYGISVLPLNKSAAITMRVDRTERTVSFSVNGISLGVAFGPAGSGAKAHIALPRVGSENTVMFPSESRAVFPAGSVASSAQALRIRATGFRGSTVVPLQMSVQRALTSVLGRLSALLIQGPSVSATEAALIPWFASNLMIGGVDESRDDAAPFVEGSSSESETRIGEIINGFAQYSGNLSHPIRSSVDLLLAWLEKVDPEPDFLRKALERSDSYRFPMCEMPFIACLLKHSGLGAELAEVLRRCRAVENGDVTPVLPTASAEMVSLWQRVKQLRGYLRQQRQSFRAISAAFQSQSVKLSTAEPESTIEPVTPAASTTSAELPPRPTRPTRRTRLSDAARRAFIGDDGTAVEPSSTEEAAAEETEVIEDSEEDDELELLVSDSNPLPYVDEERTEDERQALADIMSSIHESLRLASSPRAKPRTPVAATPSRTAPLPDEVGIESLIYYSDRIHWTPQPAGVFSQRSTADCCSVLAVGIDYTNELIYVRLHETFSVGVDTHKAFQNSQLSINKTLSMTAVEVQCDTKTPQERRGCLRFDYSSIATAFHSSLAAKPSTASLKFRFGQSDYSSVDLVLPSNHDVALELSALGITVVENGQSAIDESDTATDQFLALCDAIREKAEFLLTLTPAVKALDTTDYRSKVTLLRTLTKRYSGNFSVSGSTEDLSRWRAEERWKRVVQFLRVQSRSQSQRIPAVNPLLPPQLETVSNWDVFRASRAPSTTNIPATASRMVSSSMHSEMDIGDDDSSDSPALATMQACAVFMISDAVQATPTELNQIMQTRQLRSQTRMFGFKTLMAILEVISDPFMLSDVLLFVRPALKVNLPAAFKVPPQDKVLLTMIRKHHYLNCLEGCSVQTLAKVQGAFVELYSQLSSLLRRCIAQWEGSARRACLRFHDSAHSPARSFRAILLKNEDQEGGFSDADSSNAHILLEPIHSLLELWTLHFSTRDHGWLNRVGIVSSLTKLTSLVFQEEVANAWRDTAERYLEFTRTNAVFVAESKNVWEMWSKAYVHQGLRNGTLTMRKIVYYLYCIPLSELSEADRSAIGFTDSFAVALDTWSDSHMVEMLHRALKVVSQKKFVKDSELKKQEFEKQEQEKLRAEKITERLMPCGTFDPDHKGRPINLSGYNLEAHLADDGGGTAVCVYTNIKYDIAAGPALTGNYFEVTIVAVGRKAIGIGFANRDTFSTSGYMPGWEAHSYGYHGDDGHKFGAGGTPGDWPLFETGDVIGCGFNFSDRSIFYTRNGVLLGIGFTNVRDSYLWPVVGFANRTRQKEHVKLNFGIERFHYESDTALGHPLALEERERADDAALSELFGTNVTPGEDSSGSGIVSSSTSLKSNNMSVLVENGKSNAADLLCTSQAEFLEQNMEFKAQLAATDAFNQELAILRQQGNTVLRFLLTLATNSDSDYSSGPALDEGTATKDGNAVSAIAPPIPVLTKEVSLFGTPKAFTSADGVCLQEGIVTHLLHEFQLAVAYLDAAGSGRRSSFLALQRAQDFPGLDGTVSPSTGPAGLISAEEVSKVVYSQLILIASLFDSSKTLQDSLRRTQVLKALFAVVEQPYVASRDTAFSLLGKLLPSMQPEVVDSSLGSEWLSAVKKFDELLVGSPYRKRQGKMPINLIQALSLTSSAVIGTTSTFVESGKSLPYGSGLRAMELVDLKVHLLQKLFESPAWTELVACGVTDSLRFACSALDQLCCTDKDTGAMKLKPAQAVDIAVLELACAACATLNTMGVCRNGASVKINGDAQGVLLSYSEVTQSATYVLDRNIRAANPSLHILSVAPSAVEPVMSVVSVDLTDLSQPLLQQFFQLAEKVFKWYCAQKVSHPTSAQQSTTHTLLLRLTSLVSLTLSQLLTHQSDVINFVHDSSIIADLLTIALSTSKLSHIATCSEIINMWRETQMRCLELPLSRVPESDAVIPVDSKSADAADSHAALPSIVSEALNIDAARQAERLQISKQLSAELGAEERLCLLFLDFHMMNVQEAKESISMVKAKGTVDSSLLSFFADRAAAEESNSQDVTFEDANLLNKIGNYDPADLLLSNASQGTTESGERTHMCLLSTLECVRRAEGSVDQDEVVLLVQSELDGRRNVVPGVRQYVRLGDLLAAAATVASLKSSMDLVTPKTKSVDKPPDCFLQTHHLDARFGYVSCDLIDPTTTHRVVSALFGDVSLSQMSAFRAQLDENLTVHSARKVAARLLRDGNLNLQQDLPRDNSWVNLIKLVASSGCENFENIVPSLCTVLASTDISAVDPASAEVNALVADVMCNLCTLSNPLSLSQEVKAGANAEDKCSFLEFCSPHPFPAPSETTGVIRIPDHWKNVTLQFHPKCSTPTSRAVLEIFDSEEALAARAPLLSLSGPAADWAKAQNKCISGPLSFLWYRFSAAPASDRQTFPLLTKDNLPVIKDSTCELPASTGKVGLGEEDSLFNLFNTEATEDDGDVNTGMIECGVDFIPSGAWYFEATVTADCAVGSSQCMVGIISNEFTGAENCMLTSVHSCGLFGDGLVCMQSALKHHDDLLGEWVKGDVLGCLFDLSAPAIAMWVSRNGVWSPKLVGNVSTAGWKPAVHLAGSCKLSLNWGESRFAFPPTAEMMTELSDKSYQGVAFYIPAEENPIATALRTELAWGYHFAVQPFLNVRMKVCTEFDLVKKLSGEGSSAPKLWIWRPRACDGFLPWGDVVTSTEYPPRRSILFDKKECVAPEGCKLVLSNAKQDIAVFRLTPPPGYVALGDVVADYSASTRATSFAHKILCVPEWAVASCDIPKFLTKLRECGTGKEISTGSLWSVDNGLGGFFGSPFESRHSDASEKKTKASSFECFGVGTGYTLVGDADLESKLTGDWTAERNVLTTPSLKWTTGLLRCLLLSPAVRSQVLTPAMFTQLVQFLRSSATPRPLAAVPLLIQMIRLAQKNKVKLPLDEIKSLCKAILTLARTFTGSKSSKIPSSLLKLVDFVIEIQIAHIEDSYEKDNFNVWRRYILCTDLEEITNSTAITTFSTSTGVIESKEEDDGYGGIESKEPDITLTPGTALVGHESERVHCSEALVVADIVADLSELSSREKSTILTGHWWDRVTVPPGLLRLHRGLRLSNVENIFAKDSTIVRLRQVLKFINAIVSSSNSAKDIAALSLPPSHHAAINPVHKPYPRLLSSKIWYDLASVSTVDESSHPYRLSSYTRRIYFPGAEKLHVTFDRRCALAPGDTLRICSQFSDAPAVEKERLCLSSTTTDEVWSKGFTVQGDELTFSFESSAAGDAESRSVNPDNMWGWSSVVHAQGSTLYARADTALNLSDLSEILPADTSMEEVSVEFPKSKTPESAKADSPVSPFRTVINGLSACVPIGSTATSFAIATLEQLHSSKSIIVPGSHPATSTAADWAMQLVCLRGQLLHTGEVAVPMAHSLKVLLDRIPGADDGSAAAKVAKVLVVEFTPKFTSKSGHPTVKAAGAVFRVCVSGKFEHSHHGFVRGDLLQYRVYGMVQADLQKILSAVPIAATSLTQEISDSSVAEPVGVVGEASATPSRIAELTSESGSALLRDDADVAPVAVPPTVEDLSDLEVNLNEEVILAGEVDTSEQMWACEVCTLLNAPHLTECNACTSLRPSSSGGVTASAALAGWWCAVCTLINPISERMCAACGTARDTAGSGAEGAEGEQEDEDEEEEEEEGSEESSRSSEDGDNDADSATSEENEEEDEEENDEEEEEEEVDEEEHEVGNEEEAREAQVDLRSADRPVHAKDASTAGRLSAEVKAQVLNVRAGDDLLVITLEGKMTETEEFEARLLGAMASKGRVLTPAQMMCGLSDWSCEADCELIDHINALPGSSSSNHLFALPKKFLTYCSSTLASKNLLEIQVRAQHIERFNRHLEHLLSFVDLASDDPHSLGAMIRKCNRYLLLKVKTPLLDSAVASTTVTSGKDCPANLVLDNTKSLHSRDRGEKDPVSSQNCFVQAFQQLRDKDSLVFRCVTSSDRVFQTSFVGESGIDAGGVYREAMSRIVEDLFSEHFDLLLLCPNAQQQVHSNMDKYIPNPQHHGSKLVREMFELVGKLMAVSVRTKLYLPFEFPPLIWKKLVGEEVSSEDFMAIDAIACKQIEAVRAWDLETVDPSKQRFAYQGSDNVEREIVPGGKNRPVTCENRLEYCDAVVAARLNEFNEATAAMARGMEEVIPSRALWLFSSSQLETLVCGNPVFDMDLWKKKTDSTGVSAKTVELFWKVMETLSQKELSGFVRFAWGRSRLPAAKDFTTKMRLTHGGTAALPVSHTCFFSVELPEYPTEEAMRHGLLTAIHYGVGGILNG